MSNDDQLRFDSFLEVEDMARAEADERVGDIPHTLDHDCAEEEWYWDYLNRKEAGSEYKRYHNKVKAVRENTQSNAKKLLKESLDLSDLRKVREPDSANSHHEIILLATYAAQQEALRAAREVLDAVDYDLSFKVRGQLDAAVRRVMFRNYREPIEEMLLELLTE